MFLILRLFVIHFEISAFSLVPMLCALPQPFLSTRGWKSFAVFIPGVLPSLQSCWYFWKIWRKNGFWCWCFVRVNPDNDDSFSCTNKFTSSHCSSNCCRNRRGRKTLFFYTHGNRLVFGEYFSDVRNISQYFSVNVSHFSVNISQNISQCLVNISQISQTCCVFLVINVFVVNSFVSCNCAPRRNAGMWL